jgi:hypothetical protein
MDVNGEQRNATCSRARGELQHRVTEVMLTGVQLQWNQMNLAHLHITLQNMLLPGLAVLNAATTPSPVIAY